MLPSLRTAKYDERAEDENHADGQSKYEVCFWTAATYYKLAVDKVSTLQK
jgi:hypothetical protein